MDSKKVKKPWPTKAAMEQVYQHKLWGQNNTPFYSGEGSHHPEIVTPYIDVVSAFLGSFKNPISVCDLGCGDFNIGKQLLPLTNNYVAVDIVEDLIRYNQKYFTAPHLAFYCLDIAKDTLPKADCVIVRQVLQHLSNAEEASIVQKLADYQYVILTEHLPLGEFTPNIDIISGQGIRLKKQSGIDILKPPFHFKVKEQQQLLSYQLKNYKGVIVTCLYRVF